MIDYTEINLTTVTHVTHVALPEESRVEEKRVEEKRVEESRNKTLPLRKNVVGKVGSQKVRGKKKPPAVQGLTGG